MTRNKKLHLCEIFVVAFFLMNPLFIDMGISDMSMTVENEIKNTEEIENRNLNHLSVPEPISSNYIIDLNTEYDKPHHNITICGAVKLDMVGHLMTAGDINGDGIDDIIISIKAKTISHYGKVYVMYGRPTPSPVLDLNSADIVFHGKDYDDFLGQAALETGDVNGDGIDDILMSAHGGDGIGNAKAGCGEVYIIFGNKSLPSEWRFSAKPANITIFGVDMYDGIGQALTTGDVNGDGFCDILIGAVNGRGPNNQRYSYRGAGEVYLLYGNSSLSKTIDLATKANLTIYGAKGGDCIGSSVEVADINSDTYDDIIIGAYRINKAYLIYGNASSLSPFYIDFLNTSANLTIDDKSGSFATDIAIGDINGDNIDDTIFSSLDTTYIFYGNTSYNTNMSLNASDANCIINDTKENAMGTKLDAGNINGDDFDDLIIGGYSSVSGGIRYLAGGAYVINGSSSLPSNIDFAAQTPNITVYGAETRNFMNDFMDNAGNSVAIADFDGDNVGDLILTAPGGDGRNNDREDCGEVYVILSGDKIKPLPIIDSIKLKNGDGDNDKTCYAKYKPYHFELRIITPNDKDELKDVTLSLGYIGGQRLEYKWVKSSGSFNEVADPFNYAQLDPTSSSFNYKKTWTINFLIEFDWSFPNNDLHTINVKATGNTGLIDWLNLSNPSFKVETGLNFIGKLNVTGKTQGKLSSYDWIHGGEELKWEGLKVIYDGTTDMYPPSDSGVTVTIQDTTGGSWINNSESGKEISIISVADIKSKSTERFYINITGVPPTCDKSTVIFHLKIDADSVVFSDFYPNYYDWQTTLNPTCRIYLSDLSTSVNISSVQFRFSTDNGNNWSDWNGTGIQTEKTEFGYKSIIKPFLDNGADNLIQWHAKDTIGNPLTESDTHNIKIDTLNVTFTNPTPSPTVWHVNTSVKCGITVFDNLSGINASSIEFSTSTSGVWGYDDWQSAQQKNHSKIINCSVTPNFQEGTENYIRWRAKDVAGNGHYISENYQIKIQLNKPPTTTLISPVNNSIIYTLLPELVWSSADPDNDTSLVYSIYLNIDKDKIETQNKTALIVSNIITRYFELENPLLDNLTYYWTVIPHDGKIGGMCTSGIWEFHVQTTVEVPVTALMEPLNNSNITTTTPALSWILNYFNSSIVTYNIYIAKSPLVGDLISNKNLYQEDYKLSTFIIEDPLTRGEKYYWTVIPIAEHPSGKLEGICRSNAWSFNIELPIEYNYNFSIEIESENLSVNQGGYVSINITIKNLGDIENTISFEINKGILNANIAFKDSIIKVNIQKGEQRRLTLEIMVSPITEPKNYTILITANSDTAQLEGRELSISKTLTLEVLEKADEPVPKEPEKLYGFWDMVFMLIIVLIIFVFLVLSIFIYKTKKAKEIPTVKAELLYKTPDHLALSSGESGIDERSMLPPKQEDEGVQALDTAGAPTQYQLPRAVLTRKQRLDILEERFILGEITEETFRELKTKYESSEDFVDIEDMDLKGKLPGDDVEVVEAVETELSSDEEVETIEQEDILSSEIENIEQAELEELQTVTELPVEEPVSEVEILDIPEEVFPFPDDGLCVTCSQSLDPDVAYCWSCGTKYEKKI